METIWNLCKRYTIKKPRIYKLVENIWLEQWYIPKDTEVKMFETKNFGFIILPPETKDVRGFQIPKRIFRY